jgi:hypothetical protein
MAVVQHATPLDDTSPIVWTGRALSGVCGWATIHLSPATAAPIRALLAHGIARRDHYRGGAYIHVSRPDQSLERAEAYANAAAAVLRTYLTSVNPRIRVTVTSHVD